LAEAYETKRAERNRQLEQLERLARQQPAATSKKADLLNTMVGLPAKPSREEKLENAARDVVRSADEGQQVLMRLYGAGRKESAAEKKRAQAARRRSSKVGKTIRLATGGPRIWMRIAKSRQAKKHK
jgi:hypothetical protein